MGEFYVTAYRNFEQANEAIEEKRLSIDASWIKTSQQLAVLGRIWDTLGEEYRDLLERMLPVFEKRLQNAVRELSKLEKKQPILGGSELLDKSGKLRAANYALSKKQALEKAVQDLQSWQQKIDPSWYLTLRIVDRDLMKDQLIKRRGTENLSVARHVLDVLQVDTHPPDHVFLPEDKIHSATHSDIPYSTSKVIKVPGLGNFILDSADCSSRKDAQLFRKNVQNLAMKLQRVDADSFHLLKCHGVAHVNDPETKQLRSLDFVFHFPKGCLQPRSLRSHLLSRATHSLSDRIGLAKQLAESITYIHVLVFVHKNIRPETVLIFEKGDTHLGPLYLLGFRAFRLVDNKTFRLGNSVWSENIYQHPDRQGSNPNADYTMQHDIYSLGVCLLEIGLWESFVSKEGHGSPLLAGFEHDPSAFIGERSMKDHFTTLAREKLPIRMGEMFTEVVVNCLTCMDETNEDFGNQSEFESSDGILIGVKYVKKVKCTR
ncbi:unnamed protein product [Penicillium olsonii]|nr:unnamed protein product [Penicillium olsonii]